MQDSLSFSDLLRLIDERSTAFRVAIAGAPSLEVTVPTCPEWTLFELARHLGNGRRAWAATIDAGPDTTAKSAVDDAPAVPGERQILLSWLAESTQQLLDSLRRAGPTRGCWTWWGKSQSPQNCGAVARHQLQEIAVHAYDAQLTLGGPQPVPTEVALDGVEEFLLTICTTTVAWPHQPAAVDYHATEGRSWRNWVSGEGARAARLPTPTDEGPAETSVRGSASELVLAFYGRIPLDSLEIEGNRRLLDQLVDWDPEQ